MKTEDNPLIDSLKRAAPDKNSVAVVLKARALAWLGAIETAICTRGVFAFLAWLAVAFALISTVFGAKWAAVSCALSLAVLAHTAMAMLTSAGMLTESFAIIQQVYKKDVLQTTEKSRPEAARSAFEKIH